MKTSKKEPKKIYPRIVMQHEFFPETKNWKVGKEYEVKLKLKMTGLSIARFQNDSEFEIHGIESEGNDDKNLKKPIAPKVS